MSFRRFQPRSKERLVNTVGYVTLSAACIRANKTGFFALGSRVHPESYDSESRDIDTSSLFFGGRRSELARTIKNAEDLAARSTAENNPPASGVSTSAPEGGES